MAVTNAPGCVEDAQVLSIELPEDLQCSKPTHLEDCICKIRTGGDILEGIVNIQLNSNHFNGIGVRFEGFCRTWISDANSRIIRVNEHRFLLQVQCIKLEMQPEVDHTAGPAVRKMPFKFRVPTQIPATFASNTFDPDQPTRELYPSLKAGWDYRQLGTRKLFAQPFITYRISASVRTKETEEQRRHDVARHIAVMPTTNYPPPINADAFEAEFSLHAESRIRSHFSGRSIGSLQWATEEPQAIQVGESISHPKTVVPLRLSFQQARNVPELRIAPYKWRFKIKYRLQRRLFWATKAMSQVPTIADTEGGSQTRTRTEILYTGKHECAGVTWRNKHASMCSSIDSADEKTAPWFAVLPIVVDADKSLIPSFSCPLVSLRYSILLDIQVLGLRSSRASLSIPVQVMCPVRQGESRDDVADMLFPQIFDDEFADSLSDQATLQPPEYCHIPF